MIKDICEDCGQEVHDEWAWLITSNHVDRETGKVTWNVASELIDVETLKLIEESEKEIKEGRTLSWEDVRRRIDYSAGGEA